jgi:hypothetical protein
MKSQKSDYETEAGKGSRGEIKEAVLSSLSKGKKLRDSLDKLVYQRCYLL